VIVKHVYERIAKWWPATVVKSLSDRFYIVQNKEENLVRINKVDLQKTGSCTPLVENQSEATSTEVKRFQVRRTRAQETRSDNGLATWAVEVPERRTSSGRIYKMPAYLRDYTT